MAHAALGATGATSPATEAAGARVLALADGGRATLRRWSARGGHPVLLVHGLATSAESLDAAPGASLCGALAEQALDPWLLGLRVATPQADGVRHSTDRMLAHDLPTAVDAVRARTGRTPALVGFSLGGLLVMAHAATDGGVPAVVVLAAAARVQAPVAVDGWLAALPAGLAWPFPALTVAADPVFGRALLPALPLGWFLERRHLPAARLAALAARTLRDVPPEIHDDLRRWLGQRGHVTFGGEPLAERIDRAGCPALFVGGAADRLFRPAPVAGTAERWGRLRGLRARHVSVSEPESGRGYGHGDLCLGRHAGRDVFAPAARFLREVLA